MYFSGLQKLTLLDYPGRVACTVFTCGCNFRCPFCHNASLVLPERTGGEIIADAHPAGSFSEDQVLAFLKKRSGILDGVAVTGGEPLLHKGLAVFLEKVKSLGYSVKLDTNGSFPRYLKEIVRAGLADRVAMDIKNSPELYAATSGIPSMDLAPIEESKDFLLSGAVEYEFRTTVVMGMHTEESLLGAAEWIRGAKEYYLQQFKDSGDVIGIRDGSFSGLGSFGEAEMRAFAEAVAEVVPSVQLRGI